MTYLGLGPAEGWAAFVVGLWPGRRGFSGHWLLSCALWSGPGGHLRGYFCAVHSCLPTVETSWVCSSRLWSRVLSVMRSSKTVLEN